MTRFRAVRIVARGRLHVAVPLELDNDVVRAMRERRRLAGWPGAVSAPGGGGTPPVQPPGRRRSE